jgi:hypothetical protein
MDANNRDDLMRQLAVSPGKAMQRWKHLSASDRLAVLNYMKLFYSEDFVKRFQDGISRGKRPDLTIEITNDSSITPERLKAAGYQFKGDPGGVPMWVHPSGKEIWLLPPPKAVPPPPPSDPVARPQAVPSENEDIIEARDQANDFQQENEKFKSWAQRLKMQADRPDYYQAWSQFWTEYGDFQQRVNTYIDAVLPDMEEEMLPSERENLDKEADRIKSVSLRSGPVVTWPFDMPTPPEAQEKMERAAQQVQADSDNDSGN